MAIIYTYPQTQTLQNNDLFIISQMDAEPGSTIRQTRSISAANLVDYIIPLIPVGPGGGPFLPLTAGSTVPLTGDLYMAPTGAGPSVGSNAIVFRGVDDTGAELTSAEIFTLDSTINPSGQDLYFNNADDNGVLQTGLFIDAFQQVAIAKGAATAQLDVGGDGNFDTSLTVGTNVTFSNYGSGTNTGVATYSLAVTAAGQVIEEPLATGTVTGTGTTDNLVKFIDGPNGVIGDVPGVIEQAGEVIFGTNVRFDDVVLFDGGTVESFQNVEMLDGAAVKFVDTAGPTTDAQLSSVAGSGKLNIDGSLQFDDYGSGTITGTAAYNLSVDASGNVIETATGGGGGGVGGSGTIDNLPIWTGATTLGDSRIRRVPSGSAASTDAEIIMSNNVIVRNPPNVNTSGPYLYVKGGANIFENVLLGLRDEGNASNNNNRIEFYSGLGTGTDFDRSGRFASIYAINDGASAANGGTLSIETQSTPGTGGTVNTGQIKLLNTGQNQFGQYGSGTFTGTASYNLSVDASGNIIETATGGGGSGYKSVQVFQWTNGNPVAYTNWTNATPSPLPFDPTPLVETGTYSGTAANFAWTCSNIAGGTAGQRALFTLGASGAGTWQIDTCQHWFDQTNQVEITVTYGVSIGGVNASFDVIDEKSTELSGDKIFYGSLVREFAAGDTLNVTVEFVSGGVNPFPSDTGSRPIELTFTKLV
tara:strand:+ start:983 stop:3085 length:2103 start_codon:yes stop_codon:yes gene_type:complete